MHDGSVNTGVWRDGRGIVVTYAALVPKIWVLNPCRELDPRQLEQSRHACSVGYATCAGHLIAGCEVMTVRRCADGDVRFEVRSASRGAGWLGRAVFPFIVRSQHRFFREQLRCMEAQLRHG